MIDKIGEGGMGAVYKAEDTTLHRLVALKTLSSHLTEDEEARERFIREAQSASSLNHPNITTVHEFIEDDDTRLICMEYVEGKTIRDMVESGIVSVRKAIDIRIVVRSSTTCRASVGSWRPPQSASPGRWIDYSLKEKASFSHPDGSVSRLHFWWSQPVLSYSRQIPER